MIEKEKDNNINNQMIEFGNIYDPFLKSREKGTISWILRHLTYRKNKIFIIIWIIFATISTYLSSIISLFIGNSIQSFIDGDFNILLQSFLIILFLGILSPSIGLVARFYRERLAFHL